MPPPPGTPFLEKLGLTYRVSCTTKSMHRHEMTQKRNLREFPSPAQFHFQKYDTHLPLVDRLYPHQATSSIKLLSDFPESPAGRPTLSPL